jgi:hypothetical protein
VRYSFCKFFCNFFEKVMKGMLRSTNVPTNLDWGAPGDDESELYDEA